MFAGNKSDYHGFDRYDFEVDGCAVIVVAPRVEAVGRPWVWRAEFFDHEPKTDFMLVERGFHLVFMEVNNTFGCPWAMDRWESFYAELTGTYGLAPKSALIGLSRGGLYIYNWAARHPERVACLYADNAVMDFKSWPGGFGTGPGSLHEWLKLLGDYGFSGPMEALAYKGNPVDNLEPLAKAGIPVIHVFGDKDAAVPWEENTKVVAERYRALGGRIVTIRKPGMDHHPHCLEDPTPVVEFVMEACGVS
jgi:pimeloyl-ACP methyl ester carboxylesterase